MERYTVFAKVNEKGCVFALQSSAHLKSHEGWTAVAEGSGERYEKPQTGFTALPLTDEDGVHRYKLVNGELTERTAEEMEADRSQREEPPTASGPADEKMLERIAELERLLEAQDQQIAMLLEGVTADG